MDRLLGEPARADEINVRDMVWHKGSFRKVVQINVEVDATYLIHLEGGKVLNLVEDDLVMRGWRFIVARRLDYDSTLEA